MIEYDESIRNTLMKANINYKNVEKFFHDTVYLEQDGNRIRTVLRTKNITISTRLIEIHSLRNEYQSSVSGGCIFTLPGARRDAHEYLYFTELSKSDLERILTLKAFW